MVVDVVVVDVMVGVVVDITVGAGRSCGKECKDSGGKEFDVVNGDDDNGGDDNDVIRLMSVTCPISIFSTLMAPPVLSSCRLPKAIAGRMIEK